MFFNKTKKIMFGNKELFKEKFEFEYGEEEITVNGIEAIISFLETSTGKNSVQVSSILRNANMTWDWIVKKGVYSGTIPKRIGKIFHKTASISLSPDTLAEIGNIANKYLVKKTTYLFDFTKSLNWRNGDFGDGGSCFWGQRSNARTMISASGGGAFRFFNSSNPEQGTGRLWAVPHEGNWVLFNFYGRGNLLEKVRVIATWSGLSYRYINLSNHGRSTGVLWINGESGYILGTEEAINRINSVDLRINEVKKTSYCISCADPIPSDEVYWVLGTPFCRACFQKNYTTCTGCGIVTRRGLQTTPSGANFCLNCAISLLVRTYPDDLLLRRTECVEALVIIDDQGHAIKTFIPKSQIHKYERDNTGLFLVEKKKKITYESKEKKKVQG